MNAENQSVNKKSETLEIDRLGLGIKLFWIRLFKLVYRHPQKPSSPEGKNGLTMVNPIHSKDQDQPAYKVSLSQKSPRARQPDSQPPTIGLNIAYPVPTPYP